MRYYSRLLDQCTKDFSLYVLILVFAHGDPSCSSHGDPSFVLCFDKEDLSMNLFLNELISSAFMDKAD